MYRKITRKLSETSRKISRKFSSRRVCKTSADATKTPALKPICRAQLTQVKVTKYSDDPDAATTRDDPTLKPIFQRKRKITESRLPLVNQSDNDGQVFFTVKTNNHPVVEKSC